MRVECSVAPSAFKTMDTAVTQIWVFHAIEEVNCALLRLVMLLNITHAPSYQIFAGSKPLMSTMNRTRYLLLQLNSKTSRSATTNSVTCMELENKSISKLSSQVIVWSSKPSKVTPFKKHTIKRLWLLACSTWRRLMNESSFKQEVCLSFLSKSPSIILYSTFKIQYYLTTPEPDLTPPSPPPNNNNNGGSSPIIDLNNLNGTNNGNSSSNNTKPASFDESYYYVTDTDSGNGGGTAIVIIIAVLIIIIPLGFVISCIVKKI